MATDLVAKTELFVDMGLLRTDKRCKDRELRNAAREVMLAWEADPEDTKGGKKVAALLDDALAKAKEERMYSLVRLLLGVLVERGLDPELVWPAAERGLLAAIKLGLKYGFYALEEADTPSITDAISWVGHEFRAKHPKEWAAYDSLKSRAQLALSCLAFSEKLRLLVQRTRRDLIDAGERLVDDIEQLKFMREMMLVVPDFTLLAIHPVQRRGFRLEVSQVLTNIELYVLVADCVLGDGKKGYIEGRRPNQHVLRVAKDLRYTPKADPDVFLPFHLSHWTALKADGTLPPANDQRPQSWFWYEGLPIEIPSYKGEKVLLFQPPMMHRELGFEGTIFPLCPTVTVKKKLSTSEVDALLLEMGKAAEPLEKKAVIQEAIEREAAIKAWNKEIARLNRRDEKREAEKIEEDKKAARSTARPKTTKKKSA